MLKAKIILLAIHCSIAILVCGCGNNYECRNISEFKMDENALENGEAIKLIYTSNAPDANEKKEYYIHFIAVSQVSGDTVNILSSFRNYIQQEDVNRTFNFYRNDHYISKMVEQTEEERGAIKHIDDLGNKSSKPIDKVARDPHYDYIAINQFPTVIGSIGTKE